MPSIKGFQEALQPIAFADREQLKLDARAAGIDDEDGVRHGSGPGAIVAECFGRFFGPEAADPIGYVDRAWAADEWSRGCYGGFMPPGAWIENGSALRAPIGVLHWAGAETATVWNGYMDGAVGSGREAAAAVLVHLA